MFLLLSDITKELKIHLKTRIFPAWLWKYQTIRLVHLSLNEIENCFADITFNISFLVHNVGAAGFRMIALILSQNRMYTSMGHTGYIPFCGSYIIHHTVMDCPIRDYIARPPHEPPAILSCTQGWLATPSTPLSCGMASCWQIDSILANSGRKNSIQILNQYPFLSNILIWA